MYKYPNMQLILIIADIFEVEYTDVNGSNIANGAVCSL
jgi:hypothetical protein